MGWDGMGGCACDYASLSMYIIRASTFFFFSSARLRLEGLGHLVSAFSNVHTLSPLLMGVDGENERWMLGYMHGCGGMAIDQGRHLVTEFFN